MDLKETAILGDHAYRHWYYRSKSAAICRLIDASMPSRILEVGAGSGFFSRHLLAKTRATEAWCVDINYEKDVDSTEGEKKIYFRQRIHHIGVNLALFIDVLEHVDDDVCLLKEYVERVPDGCKFLITVPAFQFLWSGHDDFLEHKRRYTLRQLEGVIASAGLKVRHGSYYFGMVLPIAVAVRLGGRWRRKNLRSNLTRHSSFVNFILTALCRSEMAVMRFNRLAGLSVLCLAEKV